MRRRSGARGHRRRGRARRHAHNAGPGTSGACAASASRPSRLCASSTAYSSPVMCVSNSTMRPRATWTHLLCVPGSTASRSRSSSRTAPKTASLTADHVGHAGLVADDDPGNNRELPAWRARHCRRYRDGAGGTGHVGRFDPALTAADHARRDAWHRQGPSSRRAAARAPRRSRRRGSPPTPTGSARSATTCPSVSTT